MPPAARLGDNQICPMQTPAVVPIPHVGGPIMGPGVPNVMNGPSGGGTAGAGAYSRIVHEGDIIIIPTMVAHGWSQITDHVTYLSVRPDPERALPAGYVYPLLLKSLPTPATAAPAQRPQE